MKRILKQLQTGFPEIQSVELDMKFASEEEMVAIPDATQYGKQSVGKHLVVVPCLCPKNNRKSSSSLSTLVVSFLSF